MRMVDFAVNAGELVVGISICYTSICINLRKYTADDSLLEKVTVNPAEFEWVTGEGPTHPRVGETGRIVCELRSPGMWRVSRKDIGKDNTKVKNVKGELNISALAYSLLYTKKSVIMGKALLAKQFLHYTG